MPQAVTVLSNRIQANEVPTMRECLIYLSLYELFVTLLGPSVYIGSSSSEDLSVVNGSNTSCQDAKMLHYFLIVLLRRWGRYARISII